jgi:hypothetical protein
MLTEDGASVIFCSYLEALKTEGISWNRRSSSPTVVMFRSISEKSAAMQKDPPGRICPGYG